MFFGLGEQAVALREGVRDLLADACPPAVVRAAWPGGEPAVVDRLWQALGELGLLGLLVPETAGGLGLDPLVAVAALQECGYAGVPGPLVETVTVIAPLLAAAGDPAGLLPQVLAGRVRLAVQRADLVAYADGAAAVLQVVDGVRLLLPEQAKSEPVATVDGSRAAATVVGSGSALDVDPAAALATCRTGIAAFLLGLAHRQLDLTVTYTSGRTQFGVPVGSFQALKHPLADALVGVEFAWPAVLRAAHSLAAADPDAGQHVDLAKLLASQAAYRASRVCLQAHGAIGYTTEYDLHLFGKRTWALAADWGSPSELQSALAASLKLERTRP